jgi:hypothetical protein
MRRLEEEWMNQESANEPNRREGSLPNISRNSNLSTSDSTPVIGSTEDILYGVVIGMLLGVLVIFWVSHDLKRSLYN